MAEITDHIPCLRINAPEWYKRQDWRKFMRRPGLATWYIPAGARGKIAGGCGDVFFTYDNENGSDAEDIPTDIWEKICELCRSAGHYHCLVWVTNLQE